MVGMMVEGRLKDRWMDGWMAVRDTVDAGRCVGFGFRFEFGFGFEFGRGQWIWIWIWI